MAELSEAEIITKLNTIDAQIDLIAATLGTSGTGAAQYVEYKIGNKTVLGNQRLEGLVELRKYYQGLLEKIPKAIISDQPYKINPLTGADETEYIGDQ